MTLGPLAARLESGIEFPPVPTAAVEQINKMSNPPEASFAPSSCQVTARNCSIGNRTYAHKHGHNMGFQLDSGNGSVPSFPCAFGHFVDGDHRTVMSYSTGCVGGCTRRPYFSKPNVIF